MKSNHFSSSYSNNTSRIRNEDESILNNNNNLSQSQDVDNLIDWIDSLKTRYQSLKLNNLKEIQDLNTQSEKDKLDQLREKYKHKHFDEDYIKLGKLFTETQGEIEEEEDTNAQRMFDEVEDEDSVIEVLSSEKEEVEGENDSNYYKKHYHYQPDSNEDEESEDLEQSQFHDERELVENEEEEYENELDEEEQQNKMILNNQPLTYNLINGRPRLADSYRHNLNLIATQVSDTGNSSNDDIQQYTEEEERSYDYNNHDEPDQDNYNPDGQINNFNIEKGTYNNQSFYNNELEGLMDTDYLTQENQEEIVEEEEEEEEENNSDSHEDLNEFEIDQSEEENEQETNLLGDTEPGNSNHFLESSQQQEVIVLDSAEDQSSSSSGQSSSSEEENIPQIDSESDEEDAATNEGDFSIEGYEGEEENDHDNEEDDESAHSKRSVYDNLLKLANSALYQRQQHQRRTQSHHSQSGYIADSEFTDNQPQHYNRLPSQVSSLEQDDLYPINKLAPLPDAFYAHELSNHKMKVTDLDDNRSEGSLADESQFESMKLRKKFKTKSSAFSEDQILSEDMEGEIEQDQDMENGDDIPMPIFKTVKEEDPQVVLQQLKETEKKFNLKLNVVKNLEDEIRQNSEPPHSQDLPNDHQEESHMDFDTEDLTIIQVPKVESISLLNHIDPPVLDPIDESASYESEASIVNNGLNTEKTLETVNNDDFFLNGVDSSHNENQDVDIVKSTDETENEPIQVDAEAQDLSSSERHESVENISVPHIDPINDSNMNDQSNFFDHEQTINNEHILFQVQKEYDRLNNLNKAFESAEGKDSGGKTVFNQFNNTEVKSDQFNDIEVPEIDTVIETTETQIDDEMEDADDNIKNSMKDAVHNNSETNDKDETNDKGPEEMKQFEEIPVPEIDTFIETTETQIDDEMEHAENDRNEILIEVGDAEHNNTEANSKDETNKEMTEKMQQIEEIPVPEIDTIIETTETQIDDKMEDDENDRNEILIEVEDAEHNNIEANSKDETNKEIPEKMQQIEEIPVPEINTIIDTTQTQISEDTVLNEDNNQFKLFNNNEADVSEGINSPELDSVSKATHIEIDHNQENNEDLHLNDEATNDDHIVECIAEGSNFESYDKFDKPPEIEKLDETKNATNNEYLEVQNNDIDLLADLGEVEVPHVDTIIDSTESLSNEDGDASNVEPSDTHIVEAVDIVEPNEEAGNELISISNESDEVFPNIVDSKSSSADQMMDNHIDAEPMIEEIEVPELENIDDNTGSTSDSCENDDENSTEVIPSRGSSSGQDEMSEIEQNLPYDVLNTDTACPEESLESLQTDKISTGIDSEKESTVANQSRMKPDATDSYELDFPMIEAPQIDEIIDSDSISNEEETTDGNISHERDEEKNLDTVESIAEEHEQEPTQFASTDEYTKFNQDATSIDAKLETDIDNEDEVVFQKERLVDDVEEVSSTSSSRLGSESAPVAKNMDSKTDDETNKENISSNAEQSEPIQKNLKRRLDETFDLVSKRFKSAFGALAIRPKQIQDQPKIKNLQPQRPVRRFRRKRRRLRIEFPLFDGSLAALEDQGVEIEIDTEIDPELEPVQKSDEPEILEIQSETEIDPATQVIDDSGNQDVEFEKEQFRDDKILGLDLSEIGELEPDHALRDGHKFGLSHTESENEEIITNPKLRSVKPPMESLELPNSRRTSLQNRNSRYSSSTGPASRTRSKSPIKEEQSRSTSGQILKSNSETLTNDRGRKR